MSKVSLTVTDQGIEVTPAPEVSLSVQPELSVSVGGSDSINLTPAQEITLSNSSSGSISVSPSAPIDLYIGSTPGGGDALTSDPLSQFAATTSAQFAAVISDETGSGLVVFGTSPTITTPALTLETGTTPTAEGRIQWASGTDQIKIGDGLTTKTFSDDSQLATAAQGALADTALQPGAALTNLDTTVTGAQLNTLYSTNTGDQTITLTGDVSGSGTGSFSATIQNDRVTYAKMQDTSKTDVVLGRQTAGAGDPEEIDCTSQGRSIIGAATASAQRSAMGVAIGVDVQAYDATNATSSSTNTFTNKTFDANATGNSLSNVDVADLANGTDGELITWSASGTPTTVAAGTASQLLTSNGAGAAPTFQDAPVSIPTGTIIASADLNLEGTEWLRCDGDTISDTGDGGTHAGPQYEDLFNMCVSLDDNLGTEVFGTDTVKIPDLSGRVIAGLETSATRLTISGCGISGALFGDNGGVDSHTLDTSEIPSHNHTQDAHTHTQDAHSHTGARRGSQNAASGSNRYSATSATTTQTTTATNQNTTATNQATGGGGSHTNVQPTYVLMYYIKI